jgi:tRNA(Arg) A34 adenosine deaminase TadA
MAVLHSRFARVYYGAPNPGMGGLGGRTKLHTNPSLNHRFQAYHGPLKEECQLLEAQMASPPPTL